MSKTIKCKNCNTEIPSNAAVCVSCGVKNKKPLFKKVWFWVVIVILIAIIGSCSGGNDAQNKVTPDNNMETGIQEVVYAIGDTFTTKKFDIIINSVDTKNSVGSQYFNQSPADGGIYVIVNYQYKNITDTPINSFSCPSIYIVDSNGVKYDSDLTATSYYATETELNDKILSDLNPGITVKDAKVFEISEELYNKGGFTVLIDADKDVSIPIN